MAKEVRASKEKSPSKSVRQLREWFLRDVGVPKAEPFVVDDFQKDAIDHVAQGVDTLVVAPTGSGKTFIAIESIRSMVSQGRRAVYTTPLKALSNTKYSELRALFGPQYSVGLLTGDRKIEGDSQLVVATTEIYRNELYQTSERYGLIVLDEVHFLADPQRGPVWEESIILTPSTATLLMLSASISNPREISEWIEGVRGKPCHVVMKKERPVELRYGFLHPDLGVLPLAGPDGDVLPIIDQFYEAQRAHERPSGRMQRSSRQFRRRRR
ncbi:MAG: DEAD/DEAH box helicase [Bdellovibrionota bacterium]|nr:MAG: DEAD/DEAH box helicase [Bdellovibrionota bacterium]